MERPAGRAVRQGFAPSAPEHGSLEAAPPAPQARGICGDLRSDWSASEQSAGAGGQSVPPLQQALGRSAMKSSLLYRRTHTLRLARKASILNPTASSSREDVTEAYFDRIFICWIVRNVVQNAVMDYGATFAHVIKPTLVLIHHHCEHVTNRISDLWIVLCKVKLQASRSHGRLAF